MFRYKFLVLAFFLSLAAIGETTSRSTAVRKTSAKTITELGNISESTTKAQQPPTNNGLNNVTPTGAPEAAVNKKTTALSSVSCKTYEGKVFEQGEAGYNDCIRTIKNDRQGTKTVP